MNSLSRIFISHTESDSGWVERQLIPALTAAGLECHHENLFEAGRPVLQEFADAVKDCAWTLLVLSPAFFVDGSQEFVKQLAQHQSVKDKSWNVIPLIREEVDLPDDLRLLVPVRATDDIELEAVLDPLCRRFGVSTLSRQEKAKCPYPGMKPFERDSEFPFYGRQEEVGEIIERLRLHPFLAVIGASGSGKSSLVHAGLIPELNRTQLLGEGDWLTSSFRPSEGNHDQTLVSRLEAHLGGQVEDAESAKVSVESLLKVARVASPQDAKQLLLVVDQFEEVYTLQNERDEKYRLNKEDADRFQRALLTLAEVPGCYVVLTVRADFFGDLMGSPIWDKGVKDHRFELNTLGDEGMRQAIVQPALDQDVCIDQVLVERLLSEAGSEPGILPFLQETLVLLWGKLRWRYLSALDYESMVKGRRAEFRSGLEVAMAKRADAAISSLPDDEHRLVARRIMLRLVQFGEGRLHTRRQQTVAQLSSAHSDEGIFDATLTHLTEKRLLTIGDPRAGRGESNDNEKNDNKQFRSDQRSVDVAHDKLITGWPEFLRWIDGARKTEEVRRYWAGKVDRWVKHLNKRYGSGLLDRIELAECDNWIETTGAVEIGGVPRLTELQDASRKWIRIQQGMVVVIPFLLMLVAGFWLWGSRNAKTLEDVNQQRVQDASQFALEIRNSQFKEYLDCSQDLVESHRPGWRKEALEHVRLAKSADPNEEEVARLQSMIAEINTHVDFVKTDTVFERKIRSMEFAPNSSVLYCGDNRSYLPSIEAKISKIDASSGKGVGDISMVVSVRPARNGFTDLDFLPGDELLATTREGTVYFMDLAGNKKQTFGGPEYGPNMSHYFPKLDSVLTIGRESKASFGLVIFDKKSEKTRIFSFDGLIRSRCPDLENNQLIVSANGAIKFLDLEKLEYVKEIKTGSDGRVDLLNGVIAFARKDRVTLFDRDGRELGELETPDQGMPHENDFGEFKFSPGGRFIGLSDIKNHVLHLWSPINFKYLMAIQLEGEGHERLFFEFNDQETILSVSQGTATYFFDVVCPGKKTAGLFEKPIVDFDVDQNLLVSLGKIKTEIDSRLSVSDLQDNERIFDRLISKLPIQLSLAAIPTDKNGAAISSPGFARNSRVSVHFANEKPITSTVVYDRVRALDHGGEDRLVIATENSVFIQKLDSAKPAELIWSNVALLGAGVSTMIARNNRIFIGTTRGNIVCLDYTGQQIGKTRPDSAKLTALDIEEDSLLAVGDENGMLRLVQPEEINELSSIQAHDGPIQSVAWVDKRRVCTLGYDHRICCWNIKEKDEGLTLAFTIQAEIETKRVCPWRANDTIVYSCPGWLGFEILKPADCFSESIFR
ncbi:MAG: TIR domain-containing protein [Planctomycetota bacterium]